MGFQAPVVQAWKQHATTWSKKLKTLILLTVFKLFFGRVGLTAAQYREPEKPREPRGELLEASSAQHDTITPGR